MTAIDWFSHGACRGEDPGLFFPIATKEAAHRQMREAKAVCFRCAVRVQGLTYATGTGQQGIWGGTTSHERLALRQRSDRLGPEQVRALVTPAYPTWSAPITSGEGRRDIPVVAVLPSRLGSRV